MGIFDELFGDKFSPTTLEDDDSDPDLRRPPAPPSGADAPSATSVLVPDEPGDKIPTFDAFFGIDPSERKTHTEESIDNSLTAQFGRVLQAARGGAIEGMRLDDPIGLNPKTVQNLRDAGFFQSNPADPLNIFRTPIEVAAQVAIGAFDVVGRGFGAVIDGGVESILQITKEFGMGQYDRNRLGNDLHRLATSAMVVLGQSAAMRPGFVPPASRVFAARRMSRRVEKALKKTLKGHPEEVVQEAVRLSRTSITTTLEELSLQQAKAKIGKPTLEKNARASEFTHYDEVVSDYVDGLHPIRQIRDRIVKEERAGVPFPISEDPYLNMRLLAGSRGVVETVFKKSGLKWSANGDIIPNGPGLHQVLRPVKDNLENFAAWAAGKRAQVLSKRGLEVPFTNAEIKLFLNLEKKFPEFTAVMDDWLSFNNKMLDFAEKSGLLSPQMKQAYINSGDAYVPFYRLIADKTGKTSGGKVAGSVFAKAKGGTSPINEIIENMYKNTGMWVDLSLRNMAKQNVYNMIENHGLSHIATKLKRVPEDALIVDRQIAEGLKRLGVQTTKDGNVMAKVIPLGHKSLVSAKGNPIEVLFRDGKREYWEVHDPVFRKSMDSIYPEAHGMAMSIVSGFSRTLRTGVTLSPEFQIRNLVRDTQVATVQFGGKNPFFIPIATSLRGMISRFRKDDNYWEFMRNGGGFSSMVTEGRQAAKDLERFYRSRGLRPSHILDTPKKLAQGFQAVAEGFEMGTRLGAHRLIRKSGQQARRAAFEGRDISTDFAVRGSNPQLRNFMSMTPFLNARLQGLRKMVLSMKEDPVRFARRALITTTIPELALYSINKDNPDWVGLAEWDKDLFWHIPLPESMQFKGAKFFRIPKGFEIGQIFGTIPRRIFEAIETGQGKKFGNAMLRMATETFSIKPPQIGAPIFTVFGTGTKFSGAPVEPKDVLARRPSERHRPWTSESLVLLSRVMRETTGIEISPLQVQELFRGYFGTLGMYALGASDQVVSAVMGKSRKTRRPSEWPIIGTFFSTTPTISSQYSTDFYDLWGAVLEATATFEHLKGLKEGITKKNFSENERFLKNLRPHLQDNADKLSEIMKQMRGIGYSDLPPDEKKRQFDLLVGHRNKILEGQLRGLPEKFLRSRGISKPPPRLSP